MTFISIWKEPTAYSFRIENSFQKNLGVFSRLTVWQHINLFLCRIQIINEINSCLCVFCQYDIHFWIWTSVPSFDRFEALTVVTVNDMFGDNLIERACLACHQHVSCFDYFSTPKIELIVSTEKKINVKVLFSLKYILLIFQNT